MEALAAAVAVIQVLLAAGGAVAFWWLQRQVGKVDGLEGRVGRLEAQDQVFDVRLQTAASTDQMRAVIREELDRALQPLHRDLADIQVRVRALETRPQDGR